MSVAEKWKLSSTMEYIWQNSSGFFATKFLRAVSMVVYLSEDTLGNSNLEASVEDKYKKKKKNHWNPPVCGSEYTESFLLYLINSVINQVNKRKRKYKLIISLIGLTSLSPKFCVIMEFCSHFDIYGIIEKGYF